MERLSEAGNDREGVPDKSSAKMNLNHIRAAKIRFIPETNSKIGFWFKIPSSPKGFAETRAAGPSFPA
jgi:hypothetical protein